MAVTKNFVCLVCPNSCRLTVTEDNGEITVTGNSCPRGREHGINEFKRPMRMITSTVAIEGAELPRLPVVSSDVVPKDMLQSCLSDIYKVSVKAPVKCGDIIIKNIQNTGVDITASKTMKTKE